MPFGKRQLVLAALVVALGAAVYLNWQFTEHDDMISTNSIESTKELGEAKYVNNTNTSSLNIDSQTDESKNTEQLPENKDSTNNAKDKNEYFAQAKVSRQKSRDEAAELVKEVLSDAKSSESAKAEAIKQVAEVAKNIQQEANIESLIKAKGFSDCLAFIQSGECSVVVSSEDLNGSSAITIKDIIFGQASIPYDKIKITQVK